MNPIDDLDPELLLRLNAFMSEHAVMQVTSLSRASIHRKRLSGEFPEPEPISDGRVAYRMRDIQEWLEAPQAWPNRPNTLDI